MITVNKRKAQSTKLNIMSSDIGSTIKFGRYPQTASGKDHMPIDWILLAKEGSKALLISKYVLDCKQYNKANNAHIWAYSSLRRWLNHRFISRAFNTEEQKMIVATRISDDWYLMYGADFCNVTKDKVFLLSITEAMEYFQSEESRKCAATAYAKARGVYTVDNCKTTSGEEAGSWWLRSHGRNPDCAASVNIEGSLWYDSLDDPSTTDGVRPALWVDFTS